MDQQAGREFAGPLAWWAVDAVLLRFVQDFIIGELKSLRPGGGGCEMIASSWSPTLDIGRDLGVDSLERLAIASSLAEALHLSETGVQDYLLARTTLFDWAAISQTSLRHYSQRITFRTSGSTGKPKSCTHALETLEQETTELAPHFLGCTRIVTAVSSHHIYGFLFTVLLARRLCVADVPVLDVRHSSPASLQTQLRAGDLVVGHPEFWRSVARIGVRIPAGVFGVTSTGSLPEGVADALTKLGLARLLQIYGSSESAGVAWRDDESHGYRLFSYWRRSESQSASLVRLLPDGRGLGCALQDRLEWVSDDEFLPSGRIDCAVQVGGINVFPSRVRDVLLLHPQVADAAVRLMRTEEGNRLKAFIVARDHPADFSVLRAQIDDWAATRLNTPERPRAFSFGSVLPRDDTGKLVDWVVERQSSC